MSRKNAAKSALAALREGRGGAKRSDQYTVQEAEKIIDEVDDEEYERVKAKRMHDDFIVDDDDQGYGDDGGEVWDEDPEVKSRSLTDIARKAKLDRLKESGQRGINEFLGAATGVKSAAKAVVGLDEMLADFEKACEVEISRPVITQPEPAVKRLRVAPPVPIVQPTTPKPLHIEEPVVPEELPAPAELPEPVEEPMVVEQEWFSGAGGDIDEVKSAPTGDELDFYLLDAFEDGQDVYLFGKIKSGNDFASCCVTVKQIPRCVFLLHANQTEDESEIQAENVKVFNEFESMRKSGVVGGIKKYRTKPVKRNYCFEVKGVPHGRLNFLKIVYSSEFPVLPEGFKGNSFSHCFGSNTSLLELLLIKRQVMGPCWLKIQGHSFSDRTSVSWASFEAVVSGIKAITVNTDSPTPPPLNILSLSLKTILSQGNKTHEVAVVAGNFQHNCRLDSTEDELGRNRNQQSFVILRPVEGRALSRRDEEVIKREGRGVVTIENSERAILSLTLAKIQKLDPDIIIGHNSFGFDLDVLSSRLTFHKIAGWHRLGRLRRPKLSGPNKLWGGNSSLGLGRQLTVGRLVCDTYLSAREYVKESSYDLDTLVPKLLGDKRVVFDPESLPHCFDNANSVLALAHHTLTDAVFGLRLTWKLQVLPLTRQLTNLAGNLWYGSLQNRRSERNEFLLSHEFHRKKFIVPDKNTSKRVAAQEDLFEATEAADPADGKKKASYAGGLVLDPKVGLYDKFVVLLDFNSLYPSIIREFNICFTTVDRSDEGDDFMPELPPRPGPGQKEGVLPAVITRLVETRKAVKQMLKSEKDEGKRLMLEIRQQALKLTANSMYGCLGFSNSRFYAKPVAALITATGRKNLQATVDLVEQQMKFDVVYGDTDSIFVHTAQDDFNTAMNVGREIAREVNKKYAKLEIDIDGVFKKLLLLKKKKYAALKVVNWETRQFQLERKGLDLVRRDWCVLSKKIGEQILHQVLVAPEVSKENLTEWLQEYLKSVAKKMDAGEVPLEDYAITKGLTKLPHEYPDAKNQAHVMVAKRLIDAGVIVKAGNEIAYIISKGDGSVNDRARSLDEAKKGKLAPDVEWYKSQQIHPPISRLVCPTEIIDSARIAEALGLDGSRFHQEIEKVEDNADEVPVFSAEVDVEERYASLQIKFRAKFTCPKCSDKSTFAEVIKSATCQKCGVAWSDALASNFTRICLRDLQSLALQGNLVCDDDACGKTTRQPGISGTGNRCTQYECTGKLLPDISSTMFYQHICYAKDLCDKFRPEVARVAACFIEQNANDVLDKGSLFGRFRMAPTLRSG